MVAADDVDFEYVDYNFGDTDSVISLVARLVSSTPEYLRELVDNSLDSLWMADKKRKEYIITVTIDRLRNRIIVSDNSHGMTRNRMIQVPSEIGGGLESKRNWAVMINNDTSRKGQIARMRGINQVGVHAWEIVGRICLVTSRSEATSEQTWTLMFGLGEDGRKIRPKLAPESKNRPTIGTDVEISDIDPAKMSQINIRKLESFFAQEYRKDLPNSDPKIVIEIVEIDKKGQKKPSVYVSPVIAHVNEFQLSNGKQEKCLVWTSYGKSHQEWVTWSGGVLPHRHDGRCRVWWGHRRVFNDITEIEGFDCAPWNSGRLDMDFSADFCKTDSAKKVLISDPEGNFEAFKKGLKELEKALLEFLSEIDAQRPEVRDNVTKQLRNLVVDVFVDQGYLLDGFPVKKRPQVGGREEINVPIKKLGGSKSGGCPGPAGGGAKSVDILPGGKPTDTLDPSKPKKTASSRPKFEVFPMPMKPEEPRAQVRTNEENRLVAVLLNSEHSDYKTFVEPSPNGVDSRRYKIDQLISCLFSFFFGGVYSPEEMLREVDSLRYLTYVRGNLVLKK